MLVYLLNHSTAPVNLGGAERSMLQLVEDWYAIDPTLEAVFITKAPRGRFIAALEQRGWPFTAFRFRGWAGPDATLSDREKLFFARDDYRATLEIIRMMDRRRPDLVITNTVVAPWAAFAAAVVGVPHAWFVREYGDLDHGLTFQLGRADAFADIGLLSQAVFTNSLALKAHIGQYLDESLVTVVYPKVDADAVVAAAAETPAVVPFPATDAGLTITVVGRVSPSKGQWRVVEALGALAARGIPASVCLVGSDEGHDTLPALRERARVLGVADRLTIVGEQANPHAFSAAADVCVTSSGIEAFGRSTLEYMIIGRPVVATAGGGSSELVVDGVTGRLVDADSVNELVDALAAYAASPALVSKHGRAAAARSRSVLFGEHSNARAIARLQATAGMEPYRLPAIARYWFALPGLESAATARHGRATWSVIAKRLPGRLRTAVRHPVATLRRLAQR